MHNLKFKKRGRHAARGLRTRLCFFTLVLALAAMFIAFAITGHADAALRVTGLPGWLEPAVLRSLNAVWDEIPRNANIDRMGTLMIVASRLFAGYDIGINNSASNSKNNSANELAIHFTSKENMNHKWSVKLALPDLRGVARDWFVKDINTGLTLEQEILRLLSDLPAPALTWADVQFENCVRDLVTARLPGWDFSMQVILADNASYNASYNTSYNAGGGINSQVIITFRPAQSVKSPDKSGPEPLILAIQPSLYSRTLPVMFQNDLESKLIPALSPLVGVPVRWAAKHQADVEAVAREFLEDRNAVSNMRARVNVNFVPGPVSDLSAKIDSERLAFRLWVAAYAGLEGRYPEAGVFFGWNIYEQTGLELEFYLEGIVDLADFGLTRRVGVLGHLFTLFNTEFWAGAELSWPGGDWFARVRWNPSKIRRPYLWWRWSPDAGQEGAIGYQFDEHVSIEIYYDDTGTSDSKIGLRGLWSL